MWQHHGNIHNNVCVPAGARKVAGYEFGRAAVGNRIAGTDLSLTMQRSLNIELIFPIRDKASAQFMAIKAACLHMAGVIGDYEEQAVLEKAAKALTASEYSRLRLAAASVISNHWLS